MEKIQKYSDFFEQLRKFKKIQNEQKQRGLNNYNLLTSIWSSNDEVRLHSRMIYSLLNPNGEHFQDSLFLEKFLGVLKLENFLSLSKSSVYKEYKNIDLYITDRSKHIIIENKIWANDQEKQIERYINVIKEDNKNISKDDICVVYLSVDRKRPSEYSLGNLIIKDGYICKNDNKIARFININYGHEILDWLKKCQYEVRNITNLNEAFNNYKTVVKKITGNYTSNITQIEEYLQKDRVIFELAQEFYHENEKWAEYSKLDDLEKEVYHSYEKAREKIANDFFEIILVAYLKEKLDKNLEIESEIDNEDYKYKITVSNGDKKVIFASKGYSTNHDYIEINESKNRYVNKYKNRYAVETINDFNKNKAKKYYLEICKKELT